MFFLFHFKHFLQAATSRPSLSIFISEFRFFLLLQFFVAVVDSGRAICQLSEEPQRGPMGPFLGGFGGPHRVHLRRDPPGQASA